MSNKDKKTIAVVLRADFALGTGHLMRVKTLLNSLGSDFDYYLFATDFDDKLKALATEYKDIVCAPLCTLESKIKEMSPDAIIFDHYFLDASFESLFYVDSKIIIIDDLANRKHKSHVLIDPSIGRQSIDYADLVNKECELYTGQLYALIKDDFVQILNSSDRVCDRRVLIAYGGADPAHATLKAVKSITADKRVADYTFTVLTGKVNPDYDLIKELCAPFDNIKVLRHSDNVPALILQHSLALGAYGGMFSERIISKVPSICTSIASNQDKGRSIIQNTQVGVNLELSELENKDLIFSALLELETHYGFYVSQCKKVFDGKSLERINNIIKNLLK